jgi:hypothetical protein
VITLREIYKGWDGSYGPELSWTDQNNEVMGDIKKHQTENI